MTIDDLTREFPQLNRRLSARAEQVINAITPASIAATIRKYLTDTDESALTVLLNELTRIDLVHVARHRAARSKSPPTSENLIPVSLDPTPDPHREEDAKRGWDSLRAGQWLAAVFAGGSGTRLFSECPDRTMMAKGCFPITPVQGLCFYDRLAGELLDTGIVAGRLPPLLLMTSSATQRDTEHWLAQSSLWGLPKSAVILLPQDENPRLDKDGDLVAKPDGRLCWTGNGHGGIFSALERGLLPQLMKLGITQMVMANVDNINSHLLSPARLGYHLRRQHQFTLSVFKRQDPSERVGVVCQKPDGSYSVVEYTALNDPLAASEQAGNLRFPAGHINTNLLSLSALRSDLPGTLYRDRPVVIGGRTIMTSTYEMLNQHIVDLLDPARVGIYCISAPEFFLPVKSLTGKDSVASARAELARETAQLLISLGAQAVDGIAELHPCLNSTEALARCGGAKDWRLEPNSSLYLCLKHGINHEPPLSSGLVIESGARLIIRVDRPYGTIHYDPDSRVIREDETSAGKVKLGRDLRISAGAEVTIDIFGNGSLEIASDYVFTAGQNLTIGAGEHLRLGHK